MYNSGVAKPNNDKEEKIFLMLERHKSWFGGHSFASGLSPFANGKSQESSSEVVNCYYSVHLGRKYDGVVLPTVVVMTTKW